MRTVFRSLRVRNYRFWFFAAFMSATGTWMQRIAQDWLVLTELTDESGTAVGIATGLQFVPMLVLAPVTGLVADRCSTRLLLTVTQLTSGSTALVLGLLVLLDAARLWHVYVLAAVLGLASAFASPARHIFVGQMVGPGALPNAVGLNSATRHAGRMIGPAIAGLLIALVGPGPVYLVNAALFVTVVGALACMRSDELYPVPAAQRGRGQIRAGFAYVRARPDTMLIMAVVFVVSSFGMNFGITTALMARLEFDKGAGAYGLLGSVMAVGSLSGALLAARRERPRLRMVVGAAWCFGVASLVAASMPTYELFALALVPVGVAAISLMTSANAAVQISTHPAMRGRVMSLYAALSTGGGLLGAPLVGWVGETYGARFGISLGGGLSLVVAGAAGAYLVRSKHLRVRCRLIARPHLVVTAVQQGAGACGRRVRG